MKQYLELLRNINQDGDFKPDARAGLPGTKSLFGPQMEFDLKEGFPIVTTKEVNFNNIVVELLWFLKGEQNIKYLLDHGVNIWNEDAYNYMTKLYPGHSLTLNQFVECVKAGISYDNNYNYGDTGNQYPKTWRHFGEGQLVRGIDQITRVVKSIMDTPFSRRHLVSSIDPTGDQDLALYWCHALFQFNVTNAQVHEGLTWAADNEFQYDAREHTSIQEFLEEVGAPKYKLDCKLYQRSADVILGVPYNISSYCLLVEIIARVTNMIPNRFIHSFGDIHLYDNHKEAALTQLVRTPHPLPTLKFSESFDQLITQFREGDVWRLSELWDELTPDMFSLEGYQSSERIKATLNTGMKDASAK